MPRLHDFHDAEIWKGMEANKSKKGIQWHPAFVVALQGLLIDYSDVLEYKLEHPLTT